MVMLGSVFVLVKMSLAGRRRASIIGIGYRNSRLSCGLLGDCDDLFHDEELVNSIGHDRDNGRGEALRG
jgi:hypothetical protein